MTLQKTSIRNVILVLLIVAATAMRLVSYEYQTFLSNFTPVGAIALFGGAYFTDKWKAYLVVLTSMFASDIIINQLYNQPFWNAYSLGMYVCFAIMVFIGTFIKKANFVNVFLGSLAGVIVHWLIMDLPFFYGDLYPHTLAGYALSLRKAIPFEKNMVLGDALFCTLLFGGFELAKSKYTVLRTNRELAL
jgi:hypothetical protein